MRIGVVSDTHIPRRGSELPVKLRQTFRTCDMIFHLGDWVTMEVYEQLRAIAPVEGVAGNNDPNDIIRKFGWHKVLELGGRRIGLTHGHLPGGGHGAKNNAERVFAGQPVDAVLFGHSHKPYLAESGGILWFNPGSPTDKRREPKYSFGVLEITPQAIKARHIFLEAKK
ncbi:metallophosphoesterase family protein [Paenibacillus barengoltzii]|uniref:metallophosphoesterase family protein n=1 Tax=Paenibacillus barengoltzii TaxID=343517 RepID=UPI002DBBE48D|nr:metallophosphoesterase family protein [Paenibacillus barengoltzii]MEC2344783.1 metallophosphoesterase family protein [Paenibacillus barengoltzii]